PMGRSVHAKSLYYYLLAAVLWVVMLGFIAVVVIEWMAGCGESYVDANGVRHINECVFIPQRNLTKE
ncbi:hypothetical protein RZS08_11355, partial [Arthrospira platensis SPKY1]|nr:hypothetical protein [Arthrospira platensis SPKY1]